MAISFREFPWYIQALIFVALAVVVIGLGIYLPVSPVAAKRAEVTQLHDQSAALDQEVAGLEVYERRYAEFNQEMNALHKELDNLQAIVPEDKQVDEFIRLLQGAAAASGVSIRTLTAQQVVSHQYDYEMPFTITVDGPYFNVVDFFSRLSRLSRIINVGDLSLAGVDPAKNGKYAMRPGTSVTGSCTVVTFFTNPEQGQAGAAGGAGSGPAGTHAAPKPAAPPAPQKTVD